MTPDGQLREVPTPHAHELREWREGDIVNAHVLLQGTWVPITPKHEAEGNWQPGDFVNGYLCLGPKWIPVSPTVFDHHRWVPSSGTGRGGRRPLRERLEARRRAGRKPKKPRRKRASKTWVGSAPNSTVPDIASRCIKCGRPLTNPTSMRHRVGTECIKRYGSQARQIPNPAYTEWCERKARADAERAEQQVAFDAEFAREWASYEHSLAAWRAMRAGTF